MASKPKKDPKSPSAKFAKIKEDIRKGKSGKQAIVDAMKKK